MKNIYKICFTVSSLFLLALTSCTDDFLERPPLDVPVDANFYKTDQQVLAGSALLYNQVWFQYNSNASWSLGDFRGGSAVSLYNHKDMVRFNTTANTQVNYDTWKAFFNVIAQSNTFIVNVQKYAGPDVNPTLIKQTVAEARFMRAAAYSMLTMNYGAVPIITNNFTLVGDTTQVRNTSESVWKFITKDLRAAAEDLPEAGLQKGRVSKWAAEGMLARTYLTRAGIGKTEGSRNQVFLDSTKYYADRVINQSGAKLQPKYADLFLTKNENNSESLFALQWVFTGKWSSSTNTTVSDLAYSPSIANGDGFGGDFTASWWMLSKYEGIEKVSGEPSIMKGRTIDQRLKASYMLPGAHYPEITQTLETGDQELRFPYNSGDKISYASIKKYVVGKTQDNDGLAAYQSYEINTYMLRFAEMYLLYAEAALGNQTSTSDAKAMSYFNMVHTRAGLNAVTDPLTWQKIFDERIIEFSMEGQSWYDLVRLHYYNPQKAYDIISNQDRAAFYITPDRIPDPNSWTFTKTSYETVRNYPANAGNFLIPIPATELSQAPNLRKQPVDYYAGK
ncbi:RagB/SusD family nutrient uptake outer membrane protein [Flavobacterium sp. TMP13]|uniref:RagB/SusD family nutrient uptake outer membrane protein n=1 Tax=Flavobacterium sp. TMP13 TaxID=3425950 RepID=UPI003D76F34C